MSYQTGWLKANYPVEFMAAVMNCDIHLTDKLNVYKQEVDRLGIEMVAPSVNVSEAMFSVADGKVVYALGALKNVGAEAMELIVAARAEGPYLDLFDFARRVDLRKVGKRPLEMLARSGAFDCLDGNRAKVFASLDKLLAYSAAAHDEAASNQGSLFGQADVDLPAPQLPMPEDWLPTERLAEEHAAVGFYLSGHPLDEYVTPLKRLKVMTLAELTEAASVGAMTARIAGAVAGRQERKSARGNRFAFVQLSDTTGLYEVTVFSEPLEAHRDLLEPGRNIVLTVDATMEADQLKLLVRGVQPVDQVATAGAPAGLRVFLNDETAIPSLVTRLDGLETGGRGAGPLSLVLLHPDLPGEVEVALPEPYVITPEVRGAIKHVPGVVALEEV